MLAPDENADLLGESGGVREVVRDEDRRQANIPQMLSELTAHSASRVDVEGRQRLVEQEHLGVSGQSPRERDSLLFPAGEIGGLGPGKVARCRGGP